MKYFIKVLLLVSLLVSLSYTVAAVNIFSSIISDPSGWQAGVDSNSTIVWFIVITFGYSYLFFQSFLGLLGLFFGFRRRKSAFWLLSFPGLAGVILGLVWLFLFIAFDAEWPSSWLVVTIPLIDPLIAYISGLYVRRVLVPKTRSSK